MRSAKLKWILILSMLILAGCSSGGGGGGEGVSVDRPGGNTGPSETGTLIVRQTLLNRAVESEIDSVRISGYTVLEESDDPFTFNPDVAIYGPVIRPKAATYTLEDVPTRVRSIRLDYLQDGSVRGVYSQTVSIQPGIPFEITDPNYLDLAGLFTRIELVGRTYSNDPYPDPNEPFFVTPSNSAGISVTGYSAEGGQGIDLTSIAAVESNAPSVLDFSLSNFGPNAPLILGNAGRATITARFIDLRDSLEAEVFYPPEPTLNRIAVVQDGGLIRVGVPTQLNALGYFSDGSVVDITSMSEWTVPDDGESPERLSFDPSVPGLATGLNPIAAQFRVFYRPQRFGSLGLIRIADAQ